MTPKCYSYVRFSTPEQAQGDSLRRQVEQSKEYAEQNGLELDESLNLQDLGLSAFKGDHRTKGALGEFIRLVEESRIASGSILLVESLDRLSREQVLDALSQFTTIIRHGIKVVTFCDNMVYDTESINSNFGQLLMSLVIMSRAHEESRIKADRLKSAWENKRKDWTVGNGDKLITSKCPSWMSPSEDKTKFVLIPDRCKAIELIYRKKLSGKGTELIAKELNQRDDIWKPPVTRRNSAGGWQKSYVTKILSNKAVIGEFQPHKMIWHHPENKPKWSERVPAGESIPDYYPSAIDEDLFYQVQGQIRHNRETNGFAGGRTGKCSNLFVHIAKCGLCGGPMHFIDKGKPPKGDKFLVCDSARRGMGCIAKGVKYSEFEQLFFSNFEELNISSIIPGEDETKARLNELDKMITANTQQMHELDSEVSNLSDSIARTEDARVRELLEGRLIRALDDKELLQEDEGNHKKEVRALSSQKNELTFGFEQVKEVYQLLESAKDEEQINIRLKLRTEIRKLVSKIEIFPLLDKYSAVEEIEPGVVQWMSSRYVDKVRIRFKGSKKLRVLYLKGTSELE